MKCIIPVDFTDSTVLDSSIPEPDPAIDPTGIGTSPLAAYNAATTYAIGNRCIVDHIIYTSLADGNVGNYPPTDITATTQHWSKYGYTNKWSALDIYLNTKAKRSSDITYKFKSNACNGVALFGIKGRSVSIVVKNVSGAVIFSNITGLGPTNINSWSSYFFTKRLFVQNAWIEFPLLAQSTIEVTISGSDPEVGKIVLGLVKELGKTKREVTFSKTDYSVISTDTFGGIYLSKGQRAKNFEGDTYVFGDDIHDVENTTDEIASTVTAFYCANGEIDHKLHNYMLIAGYLEKWENVIEYNNVYTCSVSIKGII